MLAVFFNIRINHKPSPDAAPEDVGGFNVQTSAPP